MGKNERIIAVASLFTLVLALIYFTGTINIENNKESRVKIPEKIIQFPRKKQVKKNSIQHRVYAFIKEVGIKYPDVVYAQALIESSHFTHKNFIEKNNIFGMKKAGQRTTLGVKKEGSEYVYFKSIEECIIDYKLYQLMFIHKIKSRQDYLNRLCMRYCKDNGYEELILKVIASNEDKH